MHPTFFATPGDFRGWFERHHDAASELLVGFVKKGVGRPSITWPEAVDQALCFGWIDGVRRRLDDERYAIRFTPRKSGSRWSAVNIGRAAALQAEGLMQPAGAKAFAARTAAKSRTYSYEQAQEPKLDAALA
ncbi:MAG: bacteriocin-protection protein, partial [Planctomycetota bacterium]|nr:bacteriocin-protection protein [Planctomycetota bacterium]